MMICLVKTRALSPVDYPGRQFLFQQALFRQALFRHALFWRALFRHFKSLLMEKVVADSGLLQHRRWSCR